MTHFRDIFSAALCRSRYWDKSGSALHLCMYLPDWGTTTMCAVRLPLLRLMFAVVTTLVTGAAWSQAPAAPAQTLRIVGGLGAMHQYTRNEEPFWTKDLLRLSAGKYAAEIVPFDRAGVPGAEILRLMQYGVVPFGTALLSNIAAQNPEFAAPDLAGLNPDLPALRKSLAAFRPYMEKKLREAHGVELLAVYTYPAQVVFCKNPLKTLNDLAGRKVRVSSATQSDLVAGLGGTPVLLGMAQIVSSVSSGQVECAITGSMSGNIIGLAEQTKYIHTLPITWGLAIFAANQSAWSALPGDLRALLSREIPRLETAIWQESERETVDGFACNRGLATCRSGNKLAMTEVATTTQDEARRKELFLNTVLPRWLQRCGGRCNTLWNQTVGASTGIQVAPGP